MPTSTRINPAFRTDVGIRPYDYDALNNHLYHKIRATKAVALMIYFMTHKLEMP